jgi:hypothetical protein
MLRRLILGMVVGLLVGGALAAGFARLIGTSFLLPGGFFIALGTAALVGALTGVVAGKPIWAEGAKVEAGLKAFVGALLGAGAMFALRRWGGEFSGPEWLGGTAPLGQLPAVSLPLIAAALGALFGLDNVPDAAQPPGAVGPRKRVAPAAPTRRATGVAPADGDAADEDSAELDPRRARR